MHHICITFVNADSVDFTLVIVESEMNIDFQKDCTVLSIFKNVE